MAAFLWAPVAWVGRKGSADSLYSLVLASLKGPSVPTQTPCMSLLIHCALSGLIWHILTFPPQWQSLCSGKHGIGRLVPWVSPFLHSVLYTHRAQSTATTTLKSWPTGPALRLSAPPMVKGG